MSPPLAAFELPEFCGFKNKAEDWVTIVHALRGCKAWTDQKRCCSTKERLRNAAPIPISRLLVSVCRIVGTASSKWHSKDLDVRAHFNKSNVLLQSSDHTKDMSEASS